MLIKILTLKHWQLFLLLFAIPFLTQAGIFIYMFTMFAIPERMFGLLASDYFTRIIGLMWFISALPYIIRLLWYWAIAAYIHPKVPKSLQLNLNLFKAAFVLLAAAIFLCFIIAMLFLLSDGSWVLEYLDTLDVSVALFPVMILVTQALLLGAISYIVYFLGKTLKLAEMQAPVKFDSFIIEIVLLLFPFIGVWIIQPKLNQLVQGGADK